MPCRSSCQRCRLRESLRGRVTTAAVRLDRVAAFATEAKNTDLFEVDGGFPVVVPEQMEVSHTNLTEVTIAIVSARLFDQFRKDHASPFRKHSSMRHWN